MIEPRTADMCQKCSNLLEFGKANRPTAHLREIGQPIRYHKSGGTGWTSVSRFFQCPDCGQLWQQIEDTGYEQGGFGGQRRSLNFVEILR